MWSLDRTERIINYGLVKPTKKCDNCNRPNHIGNTHCWYCKSLFLNKQKKVV